MPSSINCFSTELLLEVFFHMRDLRNAHQKLRSPSVSQVCRSWRAVSFLAQDLWSIIAVRCNDPDDPRLSLAELFAERSGRHPLTFWVYTAVAYPRLVALICQNAHRVEGIQLYIESLSVLDSLGETAFPSVQRATIAVPSAALRVRRNTELALAFPNRLCTNLRNLTLSGGLQPSDFDLRTDEIRQLAFNFRLFSAFGDPRTDAIRVKIFETLPTLETLDATLIQPSFGPRGFQTPFHWAMRAAVKQHNLTSLRLVCTAEQFEWIPELPRLQRLQLKVFDKGQYASFPQGLHALISFFRRVGSQIEFLDLYIDTENLRRHPAIWERLLPLIPNVQALRTSLEQDDRLETLLNHDLTNPRLLPYLHTLRLDYRCSREFLHHTLYPLRAMLRSRGWKEDEDKDSWNADTRLRAVFINIPRMNLNAEGAQFLEDWQKQFRARHGRRFMLQISHHFAGGEPEIIGGSLFEN